MKEGPIWRHNLSQLDDKPPSGHFGESAGDRAAETSLDAEIPLERIKGLERLPGYTALIYQLQKILAKEGPATVSAIMSGIAENLDERGNDLAEKKKFSLSIEDLNEGQRLCLKNYSDYAEGDAYNDTEYGDDSPQAYLEMCLTEMLDKAVPNLSELARNVKFASHLASIFHSGDTVLVEMHVATVDPANGRAILEATAHANTNELMRSRIEIELPRRQPTSNQAAA